ncbi:MAG: hypothetical protein E6R04_06715 [Spirochaetes bacterium]|nr:MAG: hypothetical protein E6R04_06715 [Spirochaetota bacterium]
MTESPVLKTMNMVSTEGLAEAAGLQVGSVRVMVSRARRRREMSRPLPTDLPEPDFYLFRSPLWRKSTVTKWIKARKAANLDVPAKAPAAKKSSGKKAS